MGSGSLATLPALPTTTEKFSNSVAGTTAWSDGSTFQSGSDVIEDT